MIIRTDGGIKIPSVPPAAIDPVDNASAYPNLRISGCATFTIVAAVATADPQIAPIPRTR